MDLVQSSGLYLSSSGMQAAQVRSEPGSPFLSQALAYGRQDSMWCSAPDSPANSWRLNNSAFAAALFCRL